MAFTIDEYNALKSAYALGATYVEYGDKRVNYRSLSDMRRIISDMEAELFPSTSPNKFGRKLANYKSGFNECL